MPRLGLNGASFRPSTLQEGLQIAASVGFKAYEPRLPRVRQAAEQGLANAIGSLRKHLNMEWFPLNALESIFDHPPTDTLKRARPVFSLAAQFEIPCVVLCPAGREACGNISLSEAQAFLKVLATEAEKYNVSIAYELLGFPDRPFRLLQKAIDLVKGAGIKIVLDTFHLAVSETSPEALSEVPAELIQVVHISDAITQGLPLAKVTDSQRVLPGEGDLPLIPLLSAIRDTGYDGPVSVEVFHPKYAAQDPTQVAARAYELACEALQKAGWLKI